jgi:hypothetical protein
MMLGRLTSLVVEYLTLGFDHLTSRPFDYSTRPLPAAICLLPAIFCELPPACCLQKLTESTTSPSPSSLPPVPLSPGLPFSPALRSGLGSRLSTLGSSP